MIRSVTKSDFQLFRYGSDIFIWSEAESFCGSCKSSEDEYEYLVNSSDITVSKFNGLGVGNCLWLITIPGYDFLFRHADAGLFNLIKDNVALTDRINALTIQNNNLRQDLELEKSKSEHILAYHNL